jgi:hypothetical protein
MWQTSCPETTLLLLSPDKIEVAAARLRQSQEDLRSLQRLLLSRPDRQTTNPLARCREGVRYRQAVPGRGTCSPPRRRSTEGRGQVEKDRQVSLAPGFGK